MNLYHLALARAVANIMRIHGGDSLLRRVTGGAYNVETSTMATSVAHVTVRTVVMDYTQRMSGLGVEKTLIRAGDKQVFMVPVEGQPAPQASRDTLVLGGEDFAIITVKEINPSGTKPYAYEILARQ